MKKVFFIKPQWPGVDGYDFNIDIEFNTREAAEKYCKENSVDFYRIEESIPHRKLFFADIMARIPYGVKFRFEIEDGKYYKTVSVSHDDECPNLDSLYSYWMGKGHYIPYLRSMSSMTEEEREELQKLSDKYFSKALDKQIEESLSSSNRNESRILEYIASSVIIDWLNAHHFDYHGLINKGLAIEVTEENNPYK